ncbi:MAG: hypothetical protein CMJ58_05365 [Planctomycetaceae bacterium]|nr:hypothetical protein [Planctomycetaceae bacterium]
MATARDQRDAKAADELRAWIERLEPADGKPGDVWFAGNVAEHHARAHFPSLVQPIRELQTTFERALARPEAPHPSDIPLPTLVLGAKGLQRLMGESQRLARLLPACKELRGAIDRETSPEAADIIAAGDELARLADKLAEKFAGLNDANDRAVRETRGRLLNAFYRQAGEQLLRTLECGGLLADAQAVNAICDCFQYPGHHNEHYAAAWLGVSQRWLPHRAEGWGKLWHEYPDCKLDADLSAVQREGRRNMEALRAVAKLVRAEGWRLGGSVAAIYPRPPKTLADHIGDVADRLEREAERGPDPGRFVEENGDWTDGTLEPYPKGERWPATAESLAASRDRMGDCPGGVRERVTGVLARADAFAATRNKQTIAEALPEIRRLAVEFRTLAAEIRNAVALPPAAVHEAGNGHVDKLHHLAAAAVNDRQDRTAAEQRTAERYEHYFSPFDAVWLDLIHAPCNPVADQPLDADWLLERLQTLAQRARALDTFDGTTGTIEWLRWLPESDAAKKNRVALALAHAIAAAADGQLQRTGAAAWCAMLDSHPGNEVRTLYYSHPPTAGGGATDAPNEATATPQDDASYQRTDAAEAKPTPKGASGHKPTTGPGDAVAKLKAALTLHHKYSNGSVKNPDPIGCRKLADKAQVSDGAASEFFKRQWGNHAKYKAACRDLPRLTSDLKLLNDEYTPRDFGDLLSGDHRVGE